MAIHVPSADGSGLVPVAEIWECDPTGQLREIRKVHEGATLIWEKRDIVQITSHDGWTAQRQFRAALEERGLDYATVTELPFDVDTSQSTDLSRMFYGCSALTVAPVMDTSKVTAMTQMFRECRALTHVPDLDTSQVTTVAMMFYRCSSLTDGNVRLIGKRAGVSASNVIEFSGLTRPPFYNPDGTPAAHIVSVATTGGGSEFGSLTGQGDTGLIDDFGSIQGSGVTAIGVSFIILTQPSRTVTDGRKNYFTFSTIPAGTYVAPASPYPSSGTRYTFTEVIPDHLQ